MFYCSDNNYLKDCFRRSKKKNEVPTTTPVVETTTQEPTTVEETTQAVLTMYTTDTLNLRQSASTEAEIITQVPQEKLLQF